MRRNFGTGHWDKKLVQRMTELSVADNWEDAKHEWKATGECWWAGNSQYMPPFVSNSQQGYGKCLCGHKVVYHFEIVNTENDVIECVGSDHIESFLIIRYLEEDMNIKDATDEQIQEWIDERMKTMKSEAWWAKNGEYFTGVLEDIREADLYYNYNKAWMHDVETGMYASMPTKPRKRSVGEVGDPFYQMASITWRWDDSRNSRNQKSTRGYPNKRLMADLALFYANFVTKYEDEMKEMKETREEKIKAFKERQHQESIRIAEYRQRADERMKEQRRRMSEQRKKNNQDMANYIDSTPNGNMTQLMEFYDIGEFSSRFAKNQWELSFLKDIKVRLETKRNLTDGQLRSLHRILNNKEPATDKQLAYLMSLGYEGKEPTTKAEASRLITEYKEE